MAGSGMCTGGRVKHHLRQNIGRPESTVLFVGYQAQDTLGRQIVDGAEQVRIHGTSYPVEARIAQLHGLSAHADQSDLLRWLAAAKAPPGRLFLTHGELGPARALAGAIRERFGWDAVIPEYRQSFDLDGANAGA
jgi:metallo-beta-lactamase family protein